MRKRGKLSIVICLIIAIFFPFVFSSCAGNLGGGGGGSSSSGSGSGGGSGSGSEEQQEPNYGSPSSKDPDDFYDAVVVLTDATSAGLFYDDFTQDIKTFEYLVDREITTISEYLVYALNAVYGGVINVNGDLTYYGSAIQAINLLGTKHNELSSNGATIFDVNCPACQAKIAGLDGISHSTQLNYERAIEGGYTYESLESEDYPKGEFKTDTINSQYAWIGISNLNVEFIKDKIAYALMSEECSGTGYSEYIKCIDHLGFTNFDKSQIVQIIGEYIIGQSNLTRDDLLFTAYFANNGLVDNGSQEKFDQFPTNRDYHYYRAYSQNIKFILDVALTTAVNGVQYVDDFGEYNGQLEKLFPTMGRVNAEVFKLSDISSKVNGTWDEESGTLVGVSDEATPVLDDPKKLVGMIFIPKLNPEIVNDFKEELRKSYGDSVANSYDCNAFGIGNFNLAFKNDGDEDVTIKLKFYVSINTPESQLVLESGNYTALNDYVDNSIYGNTYGREEEEYNSDVFISETEIFLKKGRYDVDNYLAAYDISGALEKKYGKDLKMKNYDGVQVYSDNGKLSETSFYEKDGKNYVRTGNDLFTVIARTNELDEEIAGTSTNFKANSNFVQINFEYYNGDQAISPVELYLMYLSTWAS